MFQQTCKNCKKHLSAPKTDRQVFQGVSGCCRGGFNVFKVFPGNQGVSLSSYSIPMPRAARVEPGGAGKPWLVAGFTL